MAEPLVTREQAEQEIDYHRRTHCPDVACDITKAARTIVTLYDEGQRVTDLLTDAEADLENLRRLVSMSVNERNAAEDCIDRLRNGWVPRQVSDGGWWWVGRSGRRRKPQQMSPAEITVMAGKDGL